MTSNFLKSIEDKLRYLLEERLDRLVFPGVSSSLSYTLIDLIQKKIDEQVDEETIQMPDLILLKVSPDRWDAWQESLPLFEEVSQALAESWTESGYGFKTNPVIQLLQSPDLVGNKLEVNIAYTPDEITSKQTLLQKITRKTSSDSIPKEACLIVNDQEPILLSKPIIKIGRRSSSDIFLEDPMVSRDHIQLRADNGRFILFDLDSKGGTLVNGYPAHNVALKPGDVIRIGNTSLIYTHHVDHPTSNTTRVISGELE